MNCHCVKAFEKRLVYIEMEQTALIQQAKHGVSSLSKSARNNMLKRINSHGFTPDDSMTYSLSLDIELGSCCSQREAHVTRSVIMGCCFSDAILRFHLNTTAGGREIRGTFGRVWVENPPSPSLDYIKYGSFEIDNNILETIAHSIS